MRRIPAGLIAAISIGASGCASAPAPRLEESPVRITEVHFFPAPTQGDAEFIEITNVGGSPIDLAAWKVSGLGNMRIPGGTVVPAGGSIVIGKSVPAVEKLAGGRVAIPATFSGKLRNEGETIRILDPRGRIADEMTYGPEAEGYAGASATGFSLQRDDPAGLSWKAAAPTPGRHP